VAESNPAQETGKSFGSHVSPRLGGPDGGAAATTGAMEGTPFRFYRELVSLLVPCAEVSFNRRPPTTRVSKPKVPRLSGVIPLQHVLRDQDAVHLVGAIREAERARAAVHALERSLARNT